MANPLNPKLLYYSRKPRDINSDPVVVNYWDYDSKETYLKKIEDPAWSAKWQHQTVKYTINSDRYRGPEFESVVWADSIVVIGCSCVFGVGLDDSDTITAKLSLELGNTPVVNLGANGASWTFNWINSMRLADNQITPKAVVYIWPSASRYTQLIDNVGTVWNLGPWNSDEPGLGREYALDLDHATQMSREILRSLRLMWTCPQYHFTWVNEGVPGVQVLTAIEGDFARDDIHPGVKTIESWAKTIAEVIKARST